MKEPALKFTLRNLSHDLELKSRNSLVTAVLGFKRRARDCDLRHLSQQDMQGLFYCQYKCAYLVVHSSK